MRRFEWTKLESRFSFSLLSSMMSPDPRKWMNRSPPAEVPSDEFAPVAELENKLGADEVPDWLCKSELNSPGMLVS